MSYLIFAYIDAFRFKEVIVASFIVIQRWKTETIGKLSVERASRLRIKIIVSKGAEIGQMLARSSITKGLNKM